MYNAGRSPEEKQAELAKLVLREQADRTRRGGGQSEGRAAAPAPEYPGRFAKG